MKLAETDAGAVVAQDDTTGETTTESTTGETLDGEEGGEGDQGDTTSNDHVVVTIGEEAPPSEEEEAAAAPAWVKELRKTNRELTRKVREFEQQKAAPDEKAAEAVGKEPDMDDPDVDYDKEVFKKKWSEWNARKAAQENRERAAVEAQKAQTDAWQAKLDTHNKAKAEIKVPDYEEAEALAIETLSVTQRGIIVGGADNSALVIYALGKNPAKAKELASINDPVKFAFAVAKLETQLKVAPRKAPPVPERSVRGSTSVAIGADAELERLRADAEKTGDMSKVMAYKKQKRQQA
ncbi:MAG: hypothetical protein V4857_14320 [Pseudomonadota bacterium]